MAQDIELQGAQYSDVPAVELPKVGGGTASFTDVTDTTATAADVMSGAYFYTAAGARSAGTLTVPSKTSELLNDVPFADLDNMAEIPANANLNNYTTPGSYYSPSSSQSATMTNAPTTAARFVMYVMTMGANFLVQYAVDGYSPGNLYLRRSSSGTWSTWVRYARDDEIPTNVSQLTNDSGFLAAADFARISTNFETVSVANNTWTTIGTVKPTVGGRYLIHAHVRFTQNATGYREAIITANASGTSAMSRQLYASGPAVNGTTSSLLIVGGYTMTANTTYYVRVRQNSGSTLSSDASGVEILKYPV